MGDIDLTEALAAGQSMARAWSEYPASTVAAQAIHAAAPLIAAQVRAQIAEDIEAERDGFLASPRLDPTWIAGWHAATNHHARRIARGDA